MKFENVECSECGNVHEKEFFEMNLIFPRDNAAYEQSYHEFIQEWKEKVGMDKTLNNSISGWFYIQRDGFDKTIELAEKYGIKLQTC